MLLDLLHLAAYRQYLRGGIGDKDTPLTTSKSSNETQCFDQESLFIQV